MSLPPTPTPNVIELDDRVRLLLLGALNAALLLLVWQSLDGITWSTADTDSANFAALTISDVRIFAWITLAGFLVPFASSLWDWRYQVLSLLTWAAVYTVNRNNDGLKSAARDYMSKEVPEVGYRQILLLRLLLAVMTGALVALVVESGGWTVSPYTQYGITVFLLAMLLTDVFLGRVVLAVLGLIWIASIFTLGSVEDHEYAVSSVSPRMADVRELRCTARSGGNGFREVRTGWASQTSS